MNIRFFVLLIVGIFVMSFVIADNSTDNATSMMHMHGINPDGSMNYVIVGVDVIGAVIGLLLLLFLITSIGPFRGNLRNSYIFIACGIFFQLMALVYSLLMDFNIISTSLVGPIVGDEIHHILMIVGIVFFSFAVYSLREVVAGATNA